MSKLGAYGQNLAAAMKSERATTFEARNPLRASNIAVTEIADDGAYDGLTTPLPPEDGILVMVQTRDRPKRMVWEDGKLKTTTGLKAGAVMLFDLRKAWHGLRTPVRQICFYLPRQALTDIGDIEGVVTPDEFPNDYCAGNEDSIAYSLAQTLQPAFARPVEANHLFVDHIATALAAHVLRQYGGARPAANVVRLTRRKSSRAKELISESLDGDLPIALLSSECGMAATDFVRAFEATTGLAPHRWLMQRRIERAKDLLRTTSLSISEIAKMSGFVSSHHFDKVFCQTETIQRQAAASCGCATSCTVHGHDHATAWSSKLPIAELNSFLGRARLRLLGGLR
jgi:AraC family transcriptional regulator